MSLASGSNSSDVNHNVRNISNLHFGRICKNDNCTHPLLTFSKYNCSCGSFLMISSVNKPNVSCLQRSCQVLHSKVNMTMRINIVKRVIQDGCNLLWPHLWSDPYIQPRITSEIVIKEQYLRQRHLEKEINVTSSKDWYQWQSIKTFSEIILFMLQICANLCVKMVEHASMKTLVPVPRLSMVLVVNIHVCISFCSCTRVSCDELKQQFPKGCRVRTDVASVIIQHKVLLVSVTW